MKYKITFFNPMNGFKRVILITFNFDYVNHSWEYSANTVVSCNGKIYESSRRTWTDNGLKFSPEEIIAHYSNKDYASRNEYVSVKKIKF